ncbi:16S rRNA (adenine(1518)-N(6)/adenine(1519)-N(6))-dimethyltransferase RsmA [Horticoccus sp. 23ND18S-11]|uniref:16S rRNA (adenine(1518)-N(6)/adenine(1519)-N(6))- dimethyltransferase RsmA n=1 Tax=Horticoccus sp. 23ND18S-11 TaxID=3391832 RepID=UPI0039C9E225
MPLSPSETRDLLARLGHSPKRFLGQNFLVDGNIVRKSLELAGVQAGDTVVEVGPGLGTLTTALLEAGADVWAVEKDRTLHAHLEAELLPKFPSRFHLLEGDAVEQPLAGLAPVPGHEFKVVANLPYAIATPWLDEVLGGPLPSHLVLMLQQEAAQRYAAQPGTKSFGAISVFLQAAYTIAPGHKVSAGCFFPRPDVESHLLNLVRKPAPFVFSTHAKAIIRACFQQRRKQIGALLRARLPAGVTGWRELLAQHHLSDQTRPEAIPVDAWRQLSTLFPPLA